MIFSRVNFIKKDKDELDLKKSEVLKMLNEIESERKDRARSPSVPPNSNQSTFGIYMNRHYESTLQGKHLKKISLWHIFISVFLLKLI